MPQNYDAARGESAGLKPPVIRTRVQASIFGYALEKMDLPFHAYKWDRDYVLTMHDLGQLNSSIADDWNRRWSDEQREAVWAVYFSFRIEGSP